jgi:hemoglobin-like flavoprotein
MLLGCFLIITLAAGSFAATDDCCSAEDRREIQYIWKRVWASSFTARKVAIAGAVFDDLFLHNPDAKKLFTRVHVDDPTSGEFRSHLVRVANGLDNIINLLDSQSVLFEQLSHLAHQHEARTGVTKAHFEAIVASFARVLPQVSSCFNVEAWNRCFTRVTQKISANLP